MNGPHARSPIQIFRIASLVVPEAIAWHVAFSAPHPTRLTEAVTWALGPLWLLTAGAIAIRAIDALLRRRRGAGDDASLLDRIDVLTASGSAVAWTSAVAIVASVWIGWASLSVVGLMGMALLHMVVLWACLRAGGADPWRRASLSRRFVPEVVAEGAPVIEELCFSGARIPIGFRLFAAGSVGPRWPTSRYVIDDAAAGGEVRLQREVGPARRGDHRAEPLELWLQDVFGLCRSARVRAGEARLTVLPSLPAVEGARELLGEGGHDREPRAALRLPTEGTFRLREYAPGDDARRIHWVRSLAAREIVVRLPDELPPDQPAVRLVLDTYLPLGEALTCAGPAALLDALVEVWLGVARALQEAGTRVTLVTAVHEGDKVEPLRSRLTPRGLDRALRLGARVRWQEALTVEGLLADGAHPRSSPGAAPSREPSIVVSYRLQPDTPGREASRWIVVPGLVWTRFDEPFPFKSPGRLPHPFGSPDNRWSRRRRERIRRARALRDHTTFIQLCGAAAPPREGAFVARPGQAQGQEGQRTLQVHLEELR
jgi:uncharacterized protein (DUF58 family)